MGAQVQRTTVFLDRDGTLNHDSGYITSPEALILFPGVVESIARLNRSGSRLFLVTNQSAIARGLMTVEDLHLIHQKLREELEVGGGWLDGILFCPHHPEDTCDCRKPNPDLIQQATRELNVDVAQSYFVGDKSTDMKLAHTVGSIGVLVMTSQFSQEALDSMKHQNYNIGFVASSFPEAVDWIIQDARGRKWNEPDKLVKK